MPTEIIVTPLDLEAPGSRKQFRELQRAAAFINDPAASSLQAEEGWSLVDKAILSQCSTSDGTPIEEVFEDMSYMEYIAMIGRLAEARKGEVSPLTDSSSTNGRGAKAKRQSGSRTY